VRYEVFGDLGRAFKRFFSVTITQFQRTTRGMAWVDVEKCFCGWRKMLMAKTPRAGESGEAGVAAVKSDAALTKTRLSGQELKVLVAAEEGLYCKEIADRLAIMESTARQYLHRAYHKLGAANRLEAIRRLAQPPIA
jgi:DNA-binding CsgD family transcriptional regulator